jgi:hypothetical protein
VVASPGDVQAERDALPAVFEELNRGIATMHGLRLEWDAGRPIPILAFTRRDRRG